MANATPIAFRCEPATLAELEMLRTTFPEQDWRTTMQWLLEQDEVRAVIRRRVQAEMSNSRSRI